MINKNSNELVRKLIKQIKSKIQSHLRIIEFMKIIKTLIQQQKKKLVRHKSNYKNKSRGNLKTINQNFLFCKELKHQNVQQVIINFLISCNFFQEIFKSFYIFIKIILFIQFKAHPNKKEVKIQQTNLVKYTRGDNQNLLQDLLFHIVGTQFLLNKTILMKILMEMLICLSQTQSQQVKSKINNTIINNNKILKF